MTNIASGTVRTVITVSSSEIDSIIDKTATTVSAEFSTGLIVIHSDASMLSMSLVTRLNSSPR